MKVSVSLTNDSGFGPGEPLAETVAAVARVVTITNGRWDPSRLDVLAEASSRVQP